jgi:hypothetical protein
MSSSIVGNKINDFDFSKLNIINNDNKTSSIVGDKINDLDFSKLNINNIKEKKTLSIVGNERKDFDINVNFEINNDNKIKENEIPMKMKIFTNDYDSSSCDNSVDDYQNTDNTDVKIDDLYDDIEDKRDIDDTDYDDNGDLIATENGLLLSISSEKSDLQSSD